MLGIEVDQGVYWNLYSPLWGVDAKGNFTPELVTEVPTVANGGISPDGLTWKIKLRDGVKWHDGTPFTAEDVKFTIDLINNPNFKAARRAGHELVKDIQIVSPTEIHWRMEKVYAPYPSIVAWTFIVPQHILGKVSDPNSSAFAASPVGTGPFKWSERVAGDHITLVANDHYYGKGPYLERLVFKYIPDLTVLFTQFQTGDIDYIGLQGIIARSLRARRRSCPTAPSRRRLSPSSRTSPSISATRSSRNRRCARRCITRSTRRASSRRSITACRRRPKSYLPAEASACNPDLPKHEYNPATARRRSSTMRAGSPAPAASARRTACGSPSSTRRRPATTCASRRSNCCSRPGARSASR